MAITVDMWLPTRPVPGIIFAFQEPKARWGHGVPVVDGVGAVNHSGDDIRNWPWTIGICTLYNQ